ncbi:MAG: sigma-70 family RNA polymerase sigma factor [Planctomycetaceae bacterium]|nr:sigma-70 family RNA polymerase sigma factor [Planctomycetaceae bacterium]
MNDSLDPENSLPSLARSDQGDVTQVLLNVAAGRVGADQLLQLLYSELRRLAAARIAHERPGQTLQPTALVHEAWLRLIGNQSLEWASRGHFFAAAAEAMRRILVENARRKQRVRHGGELRRVSLPDVEQPVAEDDQRLLLLDQALHAFAVESPEKAELVKLRYFAGLSEKDAADVLGISRPTAARWWAWAKAWIHDHMSNPE